MSCFRLPKNKLLPSKKACKSFISTLTTNIRRLVPKTYHRLPRNTTAIHHLRRRNHQYAATVYVDRLCEADVPTGASSTAPSGLATEEASGSGAGGAAGKWKEYLESLPPIRGVDERAEDFITSFRQQMKIEREQSLLEFQEMLARSS